MKKTFLKTTTILTSAAFLTLASLSYAAPKKAHAAVASGRAMTTQPTTPVGGAVHKAAHAKNEAVDSGEMMTTNPLTPREQVEEAASTNGIGFSQENTKDFIKQESGQVTTQTSAAIESSPSAERSQSRR